MSAASPPTEAAKSPDLDALLCALVLVPRTYSRNRFFHLFEQPNVKRVRRRAKRVRGIIRQLLGQGREPAEIVGEHVLEDRVLLRFQVEHLNYQRTTSLTPLEAALIHYAMNKYRGTAVAAEDRDLVEKALSKLSQSLDTESSPGAKLEFEPDPDSPSPDSLLPERPRNV